MDAKKRLGATPRRVGGGSSATDAFSNLVSCIEAGQAAVGVIGLGHVGLHLALALQRAGFRVTGIDNDAGRVRSLRSGRSFLTDVSDLEVEDAVASGGIVPTTDLEPLGELDAIIVSVPTPLAKSKAPDLSHVMEATREIGKRLRRGQLVVFESTLYPGTTEELIRPELERGGLRVGVDFFLAHSPARVDPGNKRYALRQISKVAGGVTPRCGELTRLLYEKCVRRVSLAPSARSAEMVKLLESAFRAVNMALVNEMALMCSHLEVDVWEVIRLATTKPFGFMPFYPGPGHGGGKIAFAPMYERWKARLGGFELRLLELADRVNASMARVVVSRAMELLNERGKSIKSARVHVLGVTYKPDVCSVGDSPALDIMEILAARDAVVSYSDPYVPSLSIDGARLDALPTSPEILGGCDLVIIVTAHSKFDYEAVVRSAPLVLDTRNATGALSADNVDRSFKALLLPPERPSPVAAYDAS